MKSTLKLMNRHSLELHSYLAGLREFQLDSYFETRVLARAYELQHLVEVKIKAPNKIIALVADRYVVELIGSKNQVLSSCECPYPLPCKHQAATLLHLTVDKTTL